MELLEKILGAHRKFPVRIVHIYAVMETSHYFLSQFSGNPYYHASGAICAGIGKAMDQLSSLRIIRRMQSEGYQHVPEDERTHESSPIMPDEPTVTQFLTRAIPIDIGLTVLGGSILLLDMLSFQ